MQDQHFMETGVGKAADLLRLMGNEQRLLVLCLLIQHGEMTVGTLLQHVDLSQSALSQHLARMRDQGFITFRREAQTLYYRISNPDVERIVATLKSIFCP